jgi:hypothetical protein
MIDPEDRVALEQRLWDLEAAEKIYQAHVENLIERVYELESTVEAMKVRLKAVERATPLQRPRKTGPPVQGPVPPSAEGRTFRPPPMRPTETGND